VQSSTLAIAIGVVGATSGVLTEAVGYTMLFVLAAALGFAGVLVCLVSSKSQILAAHVC
jgi:hypothetical protein